MENKIVINNTSIADYVMFALDKIENEFTSKELEKISELTIDLGERQDNILVTKELSLFKKLKSLHIRNGYIYNDDINFFMKFEDLNDIYFEKCEFEYADLIASLKLKSLSLINCNINDYSFIRLLRNLEQLSIVNGNVEVGKINLLKNLSYLQLSYSNILDDKITLDLENLSELYIDNTNITNLSFVGNLSYLNKLSIDENQYYYNKVLIDQLISKGIEVYNDNMIKFGGEENEI